MLSRPSPAASRSTSAALSRSLSEARRLAGSRSAGWLMAQSLGPLGEQGEAGADRGAHAVAGRGGREAFGRDLAVGRGALAHGTAERLGDGPQPTDRLVGAVGGAGRPAGGV